MFVCFVYRSSSVGPTLHCLSFCLSDCMFSFFFILFFHSLSALAANKLHINPAVKPPSITAFGRY